MQSELSKYELCCCKDERSEGNEVEEEYLRRASVGIGVKGEVGSCCCCRVTSTVAILAALHRPAPSLPQLSS